ncbi:papain-like cysteine protease family protein [Paenibacillus naphthalenovorans]|uniref:papain-like cysteine protease family protein n=1 Tax=Paenibacillus naphthalenovorans TaxID=162209 RepID=UPI00088A7CE6|nr:papain-like cysteine protease family protein [Paenibacillus naphthalenovorans]SDJ86996.1 Papain-like cysteine protease AvrRpt2 [Paenibacillus naphthalenovorans]
MKFNVKSFVKPKTYLSLLLGTTILIGATNQALAYVSVPVYAQEQSNWCWAASSKMILGYYGKTSMSQCDIVKTGKGTSNCANQPGYDSQSQSAMHSYGVSSNNYSGALSLSDINNQILGSKPVYTNIQWTSGGGHALVITGTEYYSGTDYVSFNDPGGSGSRSSLSYKSFKGGSGYDRTWVSGLKDMWKYQ